MPGNFGGVGQQVVDNLFELGKATSKSVVKAGTDIATDAVEVALGAPSTVAAKVGDKKHEQGQSDAAKQQQLAQKRQAEKRRFEEVKGELAQFIERKKQLDAQIAQERQQEERQKDQVEMHEKQKRESFVQKMLKRVGAGSHGETAKMKE